MSGSEVKHPNLMLGIDKTSRQTRPDGLSGYTRRSRRVKSSPKLALQLDTTSTALIWLAY